MDQSSCKFKILNCFANCLAAAILTSFAARLPLSVVLQTPLRYFGIMDVPFRVHLPSNDSSDPENTVANWRTHLASPLRLSRSHQVALDEISFPKSWYNFQDAQEISLLPPQFERMETTARLAPGDYETEEDLVGAINRLLDKYEAGTIIKKPPQLIYLPRRHQVRIIPGVWEAVINGLPKEEQILPHFSPELRDMLGLPNYADPKFYEGFDPLHLQYIRWRRGRMGNESLPAERAMNLNPRISNVYVYSNVVAPNVVGSSHHQLLRIVPIPHNCVFGDQIVDRPPKPYFFNVGMEEIKEIEIHLKDELDQTIPFQFGRSYVVLQFKRTQMSDNLFQV